MKLLLLALLIPSIALADTFSWSAPTTRTDGTPIDPNTDILRYKFYRGNGLVAATIAKPNATTAPPTILVFTPPVGTTTYWVTAVDSAGIESGASEKKTLVVTPAPTNTPAVTPTNVPVAPLSAPGDFAHQP